MPKNAPCYNCKERIAGCHSNCEKYSQYKKKRHKLSDEIKRVKHRAWGVSYDHLVQNKTKA